MGVIFHWGILSSIFSWILNCVFDNCFWHEQESDKYFRPHGIPTILIYTSRISSLHVMVFKKNKNLRFFDLPEENVFTDSKQWNCANEMPSENFQYSRVKSIHLRRSMEFCRNKRFWKRRRRKLILWRGLEIPSNYGSSQKEKEKKSLTSQSYSIQILPPLKIFLGNLRWNPVITFAICRQSRRLNNPWI